MTKHLLARLTCAVLLIAAMSGCESSSFGVPNPGDDRPAVTVFAAASTTNAIEEIREVFTRTTDIQIQTNYAASSTLAQQIVNGAEPDIFLSANVAWADHVSSCTAKRRNLLGNRLVVVVRRESRLELESIDSLLGGEVEYLALADTDSVPAGRYARQALIKMNLWDRLKNKVVPGKDVRHALMYVETGAAEAGIVYATDATVSDRVKVTVDIPVDSTEPVVYPALLTEYGAKSTSAQRFYRFLGSPEATRVFEKYGFIAVP